jgi:transposase
MTRKSKFPREVINQKLREAEDLAAKGTSQREIAQALGISVVTYHRWRKSVDRTAGATLPDLQHENERLRRLVADLLLEKMTLEERLVALSDRSATR